MSRPKTRGELKALNLNIKAEIFDELNKYAKKTGITKTYMVEKALKEYFEKHKKELESL